MKSANKITIKKLPKVFNVCNQVLREAWKSKNISIAHVAMQPGNISLLHKHRTFTELYHILEGRGVLWLGKNKIKVVAGDMVAIKPHTPHKLKNIGKSELAHLVISTPPFNPQDIILLNEK